MTVFAGDADAPRDDESVALWQAAFAQVGIEAHLGERIFAFGKKENWWGPVGTTGPCGPDTEMFYDTGKPPCGPGCDPSCSCGKYVEIWNDVFMQYNRQADGGYLPLAQPNVDTGMGVARVTAVTSGYGDDDYRTGLFAPLIAHVEALCGCRYGADEATTRSLRIVVDHLRSATFALADGVAPSNVERGYIVRRLIRRAIRHGHALGMDGLWVAEVAAQVVDLYRDLFPELEAARGEILAELSAEEGRFAATLRRGLAEFEKLVADRAAGALSGEEAFDLYQTYGFPLELTAELAAERGLAVDEPASRRPSRLTRPSPGRA